MSDKKIELPLDPERIIQIDTDSKYFLVMPVGITHKKMMDVTETLAKFMRSDDTILVTPGDITIIRIEDGEAEVLYQSKEKDKDYQAPQVTEENDRGENSAS